MSMAWGTSEDDIAVVLEKHGIKINWHNTCDDPVVQLALDQIDADIVEDNILKYTNFDNQISESLNTIEDQLIETGFLTGPKQFGFEPEDE